MGVTPTWTVIASALFFALDLVVIGVIVARVRRKNQSRGFEVLVKPGTKKE